MGKILIETIAIAFNLKKASLDDSYEEYDEIATIEALKKELEQCGFKVILIEQNEGFLEKVLEAKPDFVLNLAEGLGRTRARESQVPALLESLEIPYSGSDPVSLGIALDKYLTNLILKSFGIPVPGMVMAKTAEGIDCLKTIFKSDKLFVVKPRWEGSSKGIFLNSLVNNFDELKERVEYVLSRYKQPALVEEFMENDEITVGVCGNERPFVLGMMKIVPRDKSQKHFLYSLENKRDWKKKIKYEPQESIPGNIRNLAEEYALKAFSVLELRDVARIDFRVGADNIPRIIDVNPLPGFSPYYSDLPILYRLKKKSYSDLVRLILKQSFIRCRAEWKQKLCLAYT